MLHLSIIKSSIRCYSPAALNLRCKLVLRGGSVASAIRYNATPFVLSIFPSSSERNDHISSAPNFKLFWGVRDFS